MRNVIPDQEMATTAEVHQPAMEQIVHKEQHNGEQQQDPKERNEHATTEADRPPVDQQNAQEEDKATTAADEQNAEEQLTSPTKSEGKIAKIGRASCRERV